MKQSRVATSARIFIAPLTIAVLAASGCWQPADPKDTSTLPDQVPVVTNASYQNASPREWLSSVLMRYRNAASYHDNGRARMTYRVGETMQTRTAPMRVWFDRNELYLETYDVRMTSDPEGVTAWIADPSTENFDSQVLRSPPLVGRPTPESLLADPILAGRVAAGLAGPPPQLDWLFSGEPMRSLFEPRHQFSFGPVRAIDDRNCRSVIVDAEDQQFQFWIDSQSAVIRRVDLPSVSVPQGSRSSLQMVHLSIDLTDATFNSPEQAPSVSKLPSSPRWVRRFVPLPPPEPPHVLGKNLSSLAGDPTFGDRVSSGKSVTVLVPSATDDAAHAAALIAAWHDRLPDETKKLIHVLQLDDHDTGVAQRLSLASGGAAVIDDDGVIAWIQTDLPAAAFPTFAAVVGDVLSGVDVPQRLRRQWSDQVNGYRQACRDAAIGGKMILP